MRYLIIYLRESEMKKIILAICVLIIVGIGACYIVNASENGVLAEYNGKKILVKDVKNYYNKTPQLQMVPFEQVYSQILDVMVNGDLVADAAKAEGVDKSEEFVNAIKDAEQKILSNIYISSLVEEKKSNNELDNLYKEFVENHKSQLEIKARHILLKTEEDAKNVIAKLEKGEDFAKLAKEFSTGPSAKRGGDLGFFAKGAMVPEFSEAAFNLKDGEYTKNPVKTQFGWHVIKTEARRTPETPKKEEVLPQLERQFSAKIVEELLAGLRSKAGVQLFGLDGKPQ